MLKPLFALLLFALVAMGAARADVAGVRVVGDGEITRITIWCDRVAEAETYLSMTGAEQQILVALADQPFASGPRQPVSSATGVAAYGWQEGFLAFTLARPMMVTRELNLPPTATEPRHRIVLDLTAVSGVRFSQTAQRQHGGLVRRANYYAASAVPDVPQPQAASLPDAHDVVLTPMDRRYLVVIDPGHGGRDPGATAVTGIVEKNVVLTAAKELRDMLEASGRYRVRLTRDDDTFVELEDRVSLAREWGADLFISLHADAAANSDVAGASVYTISTRGEARIDTEAARNDWVMPIEDGVSEDVSGILETLLKRETHSNSMMFTDLLIPQLERAGPVLRNTHRNAGFYVLLAPDVPAVLLEIGFLTNRADAERLSTDAGRRAAMTAVRVAIDGYFDHQDVVFAAN